MGLTMGLNMNWMLKNLTITILALVCITLPLASHATVDSLPETDTQAINAALNAGELDQAETLVEALVVKYPEHPEAHYIRGSVMGAQASDSIFSALSYASKAKASLQQAVALAPQNPKYLAGLITFYTMAPGIAGGDMEEAERLIDKLIKLDQREGTLKRLDFYRANEQMEAFEQLLEESLVTFAGIPDFYFVAGLHAQQQEQAERALELFTLGSQQPALTPASETARLQALYQIGRTAQISGLQLAAGKAALNEFMAQRGDNDRLPPLDWARVRLAQLHVASDQVEQARELVALVDASEDERLADEVRKLQRQLR